MTRRRDLERHRQSLEEIGKIIHSMQTLAYLETRRLTQRLENQQRLQATVERAAADFLGFHPWGAPAAEITPVYLLIGSERGFCGDFNEQVLRALDAASPRSARAGPWLIAVGRRLGAKLADHPRLAVALEGADMTEEADQVLARVVAAVNSLRERHGALSLTAVYQRLEPAGVACVALLPPSLGRTGSPASFGVPPLLNLAPGEFLLGLLEHYLVTAMQGMLYTSLMAENHRRLQQLGGAARHLERRIGTLRHRGDQLRQEEIIEEIEVLLLGAAGLSPTAWDGGYGCEARRRGSA